MVVRHVHAGASKISLPEPSDIVSEGSTKLTLRSCVDSHWLHGFIDLVIALNTCLIVYETDLGARCIEPGSDHLPECNGQSFVVMVLNVAFLVIYVFELVLKLWALRANFFLSASNVFDFIVIAAILVFAFLSAVFHISGPNVGILRMARVMRILKAISAATTIEEVKIFISGMSSALMAILVGGALMLFSIFVFALVCVITIHPVNVRITESGLYDEMGCERCKVAYSCVSSAMLTLLQTVILGDGWGEYNLVIIKESPLTVVVFIIVSISITYGLSNLVIAVICDKALAAREINLKKLAADKIQEVTSARSSLVGLCRKLDRDASGFLSLQEFMNGYENQYFRDCLTVLDIERDDLDIVFKMLDKNNDGKVSYEEFALQLQNLKSQDIHTMTSFIKFYVLEIHDMHATLIDAHHLLRESQQLLVERMTSAVGARASVAVASVSPLRLPARSGEGMQDQGEAGAREEDHGSSDTSATFAGTSAEPCSSHVLDTQLDELLRSFDAQTREHGEALLRESAMLASDIRATLCDLSADASSTSRRPKVHRLKLPCNDAIPSLREKKKHDGDNEPEKISMPRSQRILKVASVPVSDWPQSLFDPIVSGESTRSQSIPDPN